MLVPQAQIKLNLPLPLKGYLQTKADQFGMPLSGYLRHLVLKDVEDLAYPVYPASDWTIKKAEEALKNKDKSVLVEDINKFFAEL